MNDFVKPVILAAGGVFSHSTRRDWLEDWRTMIESGRGMFRTGGDGEGMRKGSESSRLLFN